MTNKLFIVSDPNIGDAVCAMAAIQFIAETEKQVWVIAENNDVLLCMQPSNMRSLDQLPTNSHMNVINLSIGKSISERGRYAHTIQQYLQQAGVTYDRVPQPHFGPLGEFNPKTGRTEIVAAQYDYVIAPWSLDLQRVWPSDQYVKLFNTLRRLNHDASIAIIGGISDPRPWDDVDYVYGASLSSVVQMMRIARRAVITIDSGPNRLAHAANIKHHVILCPDIYPECWVTHPTATTIVGNPHTWTVEAIMNALERLDTWQNPPQPFAKVS